jgi:hypothetical protein
MLDCVKRPDTRAVKGDQCERVAEPSQLCGWIDPGEPINAPLDRPEEPSKEGRLAAEDARHVAAERPDQQCDSDRE